ncbi:tetratricopeptide repeat protein [Aliisedimentitalea scapharcae]|uniref:Tetratricopeptide repeat protein n=1 Tax=Aliisedimentitalea scapharcae TaxID=1524259 RepID=A0ABZ2XVJ0_9RHOB|nr:tetratricopeptide repeat protein [Rhodobacteraceae bacterium M382]
MSFTITNTFEPLIWGFKPDSDMKVALEAGWTRSDVIWERLMERALAAWDATPRKASRSRSARLFKLADLVARYRFDATDVRRAASVANLAIVEQARGNHAASETYQKQALQIWKGAHHAVQNMRVLPRSRSSLFHLRMEALHRDTFHNNLKTRIGLIADETEMTLRELTSGRPSGHRHASRWRGERPNVYDDTRKILGACLLILDA